MKHLLLILLLLFPILTRAQQDTLARPSMLSAGIGVSLSTGGALLTLNPVLNNLQTSLRDAMQQTPHQPLGIDDPLQVLPLVGVPLLHVCGLKSRHSLADIALLEGSCFLLGSVMVQSIKYGIRVDRPSGPGINSFPSGHTFMAMLGADLIRREYGQRYPWVAVAGYTLATLVASLRLYNDRHWLGDVMAGAGIALVSTSISYWLFDK